MKVKAFSARPDEAPYFDLFAKQYGQELEKCPDALTMDNIDSVKGFEGLSLVHDGNLTDEVLKAAHDRGVKYIALRTIGYDGINLKLARDLGMRISNASYSPYSVANYTVMLMLMCIRRALYILMRSHTADDSLGSARGMEMQNMTVGVIGTGRIGKAVIQNLRGFGCKIIAYDIYPSDIAGVEYVTLDELYRRSDIITLHTFLSPQTEHMINAESLAKMKDGVIIINAARGGLVDEAALLRALKNGRLAGAGLDVFANEPDFNQEFCQLDNVILTPHAGSATKEARRNVLKEASYNLLSFLVDGQPVNRVN